MTNHSHTRTEYTLYAGKSEYPVSGIPFVLFSLPVSDPKYFHINGFKTGAWFSVWTVYALFTHCMYTVSPVCGVLAVQFTAGRGHDAPKNLKST